MTLEPTSTSQDSPAQDAPAKTPRRRVTRSAAAPAAQPTTGAAASAAGQDAPTDDTPAKAPAKARASRRKSAVAPAAETAAETPASSEQQPEPAPEAQERPRRTSRRATRTAPSVPVEDATSAPAASGAETSGASGAPVLDVLAELGARGAEASSTAGPAAEAADPAPRGTRRGSRGAVRRGAGVPASEEPAPVAGALEPADSAPAPAAEAAAAPVRRRGGRKAAAAGAAATDASATPEVSGVPAEASTDSSSTDSSSTEPPSAEAPAAEKPTRTRGRRSRAAAPAPEPDPVVEEDEEDAETETDPASADPASVTPAGTGQADAPQAAPTGPSGGGRLATTALLFQAPQAPEPRTRRRAQAPAGPPRPVEEPVVADAGAVDADAVTDAQEPAVASEAAPSGRRRRGRGTDAARVEVDLAEELAELAGTGTKSVEEEPQGPDEDADEPEAEEGADAPKRRRRRGGRGRRGRSAEGESPAEEGTAEPAETSDAEGDEDDATDATESADEGGSSRRRRRRRRGGRGGDAESREAAGGRSRGSEARDEVTALKGSTRLEAKRQRRREGRDAGRRRTIVTEAEFLARRESVSRSMIVRESNGRTQIAVLEDGVLVEHYVSQQSQSSMVGNVYLGRVQNVLPSMEAAFVDVGKGRNAVLYAGEVNWDAAGLSGQPRRIEQALKSGDSVLVQVTKDPIGHKGARLTSQVTLAGRYLVYVPHGGMTGISRKLPDTERSRLKRILREAVPDSAGVIVRTAAEGASEEELRADIARLQDQWAAIEKKAKSASAPALLQGEPDLAIRVVRDIFNDDFASLVVSGDSAWDEVSGYVNALAPDLASRVTRWTGQGDVFTEHRIDEQLAKGMDRKVWLPSGGSLVIDRTEAMTVVDVNTGKFTGAGGTLEETVTRNNLEAAEEIVRQLRLRDIGGIIVIDFIDMVLESNRDLVLRRLVECLGRDRTKHQVAEVTSLGLVQMTRKRVGQGLVEAFSETCDHCNGRGFLVHSQPIDRGGRSGDAGQGGSGQGTSGQGGSGGSSADEGAPSGKRSRRKRGGSQEQTSPAPQVVVPVLPEASSEAREAVKATLATIAAAAAHAHESSHETDGPTGDGSAVDASTVDAPTVDGSAVDGQGPGADAPTPEASVAEGIPAED